MPNFVEGDPCPASLPLAGGYSQRDEGQTSNAFAHLGAARFKCNLVVLTTEQLPCSTLGFSVLGQLHFVLWGRTKHFPFLNLCPHLTTSAECLALSSGTETFKCWFLHTLLWSKGRRPLSSVNVSEHHLFFTFFFLLSICWISLLSFMGFS